MRLKIFSKRLPFTHEAFMHAYSVLSRQEDNHVLLESGRGGRYSICGITPMAILEGTENGLLIKERHKQPIKLKGDPLLLMREWMADRKVEHRNDLPDFQGGAIGFLSYDYARSIERLPEISRNDLDVPALYFLIFEEMAVFDHKDNELYVMKIGEAAYKADCMKRLDELAAAFIQSKDKELPPFPPVGSHADRTVSVSMTEADFIDAVERIQAYIAAGDLFQVNFSVRQSKPLLSHPYEIYKELRALNPSPYMSYLHTPLFQVVSGSPELLLKKKGKVISTRPIAGTRSRGKNETEDQQLAEELLDNEKERAEHVMLVDLERNDLGRVCSYGTVAVDEFMVVEKYSHVMHIVSNVKGELAEGFDGYDAVRAAFPGGTITGAPKIRTMEVIEELEPVRRGLYTGSIGWIGFDGDLEMNIVIRTLFAQDGIGHIQAGAGVVIDSKPIYEYRESLKKAAAVWKAMDLADNQVEGAARIDFDD
ncbi:anthranilate synthase component I family protein [Bacillus testis]|uniref:anthranilate synthase component I family protein n=1 Tax=Bacillus testis TaxID=1622072 RepID=UPI00067EA9AA|nr:anthranilate synthase component I family protein [Bacillus testis]